MLVEEEKDIMIELTMPFVKFGYTAKSEQHKRASGIQYMLLKMIGYSEQVASNLKVKDVMSIFSISVDLTPFIISELALLANTHMVTLTGVSVDKLSPNTPMNMIKINESSRPLYETGYVRSKMEDLKDELLYLPMRTEQFRKVTDMQNTQTIRAKIEVNPKELEMYLRHIHPNSEISDVKIDRERKDQDGNVVSQGPKIKGYSQNVYLYFNLVEGCFEVDVDRSGIDLDKLKNAFKGEVLLKKLDEGVFTLNDEDGLEVNSWAMEPPKNVTKRILPREFQVMKGLFFYGNRIKNNNPPSSMFHKMNRDLGCDALLVTDSEHICKYWFAKGDVAVKGFEGVKKNQNMVYFQPIVSAETVKQCIQEATSNLKLPGDFDLLDKISSAAHNPAIFAEAVCERVKNGSRTILGDTLAQIEKLPQKVWKPLVESGLEEIACMKVSADEDLKDVADFCSICKKNGYEIIGTRLIGAMKDKYRIAKVADWAIMNDIGKNVALSDEDLPKDIADLIWNGGSETYESELLGNITSAYESFSQLRNVTSIEDPKKYCFEILSFDGDLSEIPNLVNTLYTSLDNISVALPPFTKVSETKVLFGLKPVFTALSGYAKSKKTKWGRSDIRKEENSLLFCTVLRRKMSQALSRLGAEDLAELKKQKIVDAECIKDLTKFNKESERICTSSFDESIDLDSRTRWVNAVLKLEELS